MGVYDYHKEIPEAKPVTMFEKMPEVTEDNPYKAYVEVEARFTTDGRLLPVFLLWEDGRRFTVDRIKRIQRMASRKAGGRGICYTCIILGQEIQLFYEENGLWFVARKTAGSSAGSRPGHAADQ